MSTQTKKTANQKANQELSEEERIKRLHKKAMNEALKILGIFGLPAILGILVGQLIDNLLNIAPFGSLIVLMLMFVGSWVVVLRTTLQIRKAGEQQEGNESSEDE